MGRVWKARDEVLHRDVAIKELVPPPSLTDDERREMRERSLREARAIARLNHANVVRIFDVLRTDGDPWIVMEYVPSKSLQDTLAEDGPVSPAKAVEIGLGVLGALKAAHKAGVMHRDIKPGNVLLGSDGRVVLTDFGLATIPGDPNVTRTGMVLGSPAYIAPERAKDGTAGPEADLWSLGATLYAAVEGKSPYARPSAIGTLAALATEPLPPPKNAGPLKPVLQGLLRKDPAQRINAEVAERLLRRAGGKRAKGISLLDGVRRPGPNGPREPRSPLVPAPRPAEERAAAPPTPPAPRAPQAGPVAATSAGMVGADDATAMAPSDAGPAGGPVAATNEDMVGADDATALAPSDAPHAGAAPTAKVDRPEPAADAEPTSRVEPSKPTAPTFVMPAPVSPAAAPAGRVPGPVYDGTKRGAEAEPADRRAGGGAAGRSRRARAVARPGRRRPGAGRAAGRPDRRRRDVRRPDVRAGRAPADQCRAEPDAAGHPLHRPERAASGLDPAQGADFLHPAPAGLERQPPGFGHCRVLPAWRGGRDAGSVDQQPAA